MSNQNTSEQSRVFHVEGVRQLIFEFARRARWGELDEARNLVIGRNQRVRVPLNTAQGRSCRRNPEDQLHLTDQFNWRETAALLGLYWAFAPQ